MINKKYLKEFINKEIKKYLNDKGEVAKDLNGNLPKQDSFNETYLISEFAKHYDTSNKEIKIKSLSVNFEEIERDVKSNEFLSGILLLHELANILLQKLLKKEFVFVSVHEIFKLINYKVEDKTLEKLNNTKFKKILFEINFNLEKNKNKTLEESLEILSNNILLSNENIEKQNFIDEFNKIKEMNDFNYINRHFQGFKIEINNISYKELKDMFRGCCICFNKNTKLYLKSFIKPNIEYVESKYHFAILKEFITIKFIL
ncbi:hypothetical protein [Fusobacterium periodonticum]|uniref:Uncharacterized protein n=1 Tax=Fusobacterium periodonticum ATCC 33693 TaxID=546275 RepID=D4CXJ5_9FUSO|nr:hypothetical protein [Fusobacterium periodonticum]EFE86115.1 hypothetical protein FUSPEROL_02156 [Fusobacterium periodonticum ATCC 33693]